MTKEEEEEEEEEEEVGSLSLLAALACKLSQWAHAERAAGRPLEP